MDRHDEHSAHDEHAPEHTHGAHDETTHAQPDAKVRAQGEPRRFQSVEDLLGNGSVDEQRVYEIGKPPVAGDGSDLDRRDFMKVLSATFAAAGLTSACGKLPEQYAIPYAQKPEEVTPGRASYYATTCKACGAGCGVLLKSRDGRPIKVEGNPEHPLSLGGVCAIGQASVLNLYDGDRYKKPKVGGKDADWLALDGEVAKTLAAYKADGSKLAVLSRRQTGPATSAVLADFLAQFPGSRHVAYEPANLSAIATAHGLTHGQSIMPSMLFERADLVVSFGADFLGTWLQPVAFTKSWSRTRKLSADRKTMSKLVVAESHMTLTGTNADERLRTLPSEERALVFGLASRIAQATNFSQVAAPATDKGAVLDAWAKALLEAKGRSLVLSGSSDIAVQAAVNLINEQLGNYGKTLDQNSPMHVGGDQAAVDKLLQDMETGAVTGIVVMDVNPAYDSDRAMEWAERITKAAVSIAISQRPDETAQLCRIVAAVHHPYEAWGDSEPRRGLLNVQQPLVRPLFDTRSAEDTLLVWSGSKLTMLPYMQAHWQAKVLPRATGKVADFQSFWDKTVQDGFAVLSRQNVASRLGAIRAGGPALAQAPQPLAAELAAEASPAALAADASPTAGSLGAAVGLPEAATPAAAPVQLVSAPATRFDAAGVQKALGLAGPKAAGAGAYELVLYPTVALGDGTHANNPFLQELPDPITKATWGNYACISPKTAAKLGVGNSDVVKISAGTVSVELPVVLAPGLHDGAIALAVGYGRKGAGRVGNDVGANVRPFSALAWSAGAGAGLVKADVHKTGKVDTVAFSQTHHSYEHRDIVRETSLAEWQKDVHAGNPPVNPMLLEPHGTGFAGQNKRQTRSLWGRHEFPTYRWGMAIDLNSCTGCGACVLACNIENNIPVVGKREVTVRREMHWLRIDRYFSERKEVKGYDWDPTEDDLLALADNPEVVHQPMLCQHCENAPCETVCPVLATVHTSEGLNAQVYNRCIGTRYCANNCPYKVRRFNWFNYPHGDMDGKQDIDLVALALNPDIVKRTRGVMEKCSFCVQRIQDAKADSVHEGRDGLRDGDVQTACQQTCPADAITFGNLNDDHSSVRKMYEDPRNFSVIPEVGTQPVVSYMTKVRNAPRAQQTKAETAADKAEG